MTDPVAPTVTAKQWQESPSVAAQSMGAASDEAAGYSEPTGWLLAGAIGGELFRRFGNAIVSKLPGPYGSIGQVVTSIFRKSPRDSNSA